MDKQFWKAIQENEYKIPEDHSINSLTPELLGFLGSTDPELRDELAYAVLVEWVDHDLYTSDELRQIIISLCANLEVAIGEAKTDSVFLRAFSVLVLALIVYYDNKKPFLKSEEITAILETGLQYLAAEKDPRGYIPVKGWAHALAHTADLLLVLAENHHTDAGQHLRILNGISEKLTNASDWVYVHSEDDRLSAAVLIILQRGLLRIDEIQEWLASLTENWKGAWADEERTRAFFNVRNFTRSLYLQVTTEEDLPRKEMLEEIILDAVQGLRAW